MSKPCRKVPAPSFNSPRTAPVQTRRCYQAGAAEGAALFIYLFDPIISAGLRSD